MSKTVEAVYQGGVFRPVRPVDLPENQHVQVRVDDVQAGHSRLVNCGRGVAKGLRDPPRIFTRFNLPHRGGSDARCLTGSLTAASRRNGQCRKSIPVTRRRLIQHVIPAGGQLWVLDVGLAEVTNVIWKYYHRRSASLDDARQMLAFLMTVPVQVAAAQPLLSPAFELAAKYDVAVYDALFVCLCHDRRLAGITADEPLWKAIHADFPQIELLRLWQPPP